MDGFWRSDVLNAGLLGWGLSTAVVLEDTQRGCKHVLVLLLVRDGRGALEWLLLRGCQPWLNSVGVLDGLLGWVDRSLLGRNDLDLSLEAGIAAC